jgi:hypothetical protein
VRHDIVHLYVAELQKQVKSHETMIQRLKELFKTTSQQYREACYILFGYKIDLIPPNVYHLSSMYAESENDYLKFKVYIRIKLPFILLEASLHSVMKINKGTEGKLYMFQVFAVDLGVSSAVCCILFMSGKEPPSIHRLRGFICPMVWIWL